MPHSKQGNKISIQKCTKITEFETFQCYNNPKNLTCGSKKRLEKKHTDTRLTALCAGLPG